MSSSLRSVLLSWLPATLPLRAPLSWRSLLGRGSPRRRLGVLFVSFLVQNIVCISCHGKLLPLPHCSHGLGSERTSRLCMGRESESERRCGAETGQPPKFAPSVSGVQPVFPRSPSSLTISPQLSRRCVVGPSLVSLCMPLGRNRVSLALAFSSPLKGAHAWVCAAAQPNSLSSAVPRFGAASCLPVSSLLVSSFTNGSPAATPRFRQNWGTASPSFAPSSFAAVPSFLFCSSTRSRCATCSSFVSFSQLSSDTTKSRAYSPFAPFAPSVPHGFQVSNVRRGTVSFDRVRGASARKWHSAFSNRRSGQLSSCLRWASRCPPSTASVARSPPSLTFWWSESRWTRGLARLPCLSLFSGSHTPCPAATSFTPGNFQVFYPFDYICLTSPEASRIFASSWEEAVSAAVLSSSFHLSLSRSSPSAFNPSSVGSHASSPLSLPLPLLRPGSIVCVGEGTRQAAEEALVEAFLRLLAIRSRTEGSGNGRKDGENGRATGQRDSQQGAPVHTRGRDCAGGLVSRTRGQQREQTKPTYGNGGGESQQHCREAERKTEAEQKGQNHQEALAHIRSFFSSFAPSMATGASLAEELPPRPPILSMLSVPLSNESTCSSPVSFASSAPPVSAVPRAPVHARFTGCLTTTIADSQCRPESARKAHEENRPGSSLCPYCCLRTRVLWPTSALASDLLSTRLEQRKLSEISRVVFPPGSSLLTADHNDQDVERNNEALVHGNAAVGRADGEASQAEMARSFGMGMKVGTMESVAVSQLLKAVLGAKSSCPPPQSVPATQGVVEGNHLSSAVCPLDNEVEEDPRGRSSGTDRRAEGESTANWDLLPAFSVQRLNIYTTAQRMLSVDERQALIGHIRHAIGRNEECAPNGENVSVRYLKKGAAPPSGSGEEEAKNQPEEKGCSAVFVMLGSPSAVWSWVANGLPLSTAALCSPELPSYTAVHAGARQFHFPVDSPVAASLSSSPSSSHSSGGPSAQASLPPKAPSATLCSPPAGTATHGICASPRDVDAGRLQVTTISRKADFARLLDEFRTALSAGQERRLRSRKQPEQLVAVAIGPSTAAAARQAGFAKVIVAPRPGLEGWADAVVKAAKRIVKEGKSRSQTPQLGRRDEKADEQVRVDEAIGDVEEENHDTIVTSLQEQRHKRVTSRPVARAGDAHEKVEAIERRSEAMWQGRRELNPVTPARQNHREAVEDGQQHPDQNVASCRIVVLLTREQSKNGAVVAQLKRRGDVDVREATLLSSPDGDSGEVIPAPSSEEDTAKRPQQVSSRSAAFGYRAEEGDEGQNNAGIDSDDTDRLGLEVIEVPLLRTQSTGGVFSRQQRVLSNLMRPPRFLRVGETP